MSKLKNVRITAILTLDVPIPEDFTPECLDSIKSEAWDELDRALQLTDFLIEEVVLE